MTIAVIVACHDSFYMVVDSLTRGEHYFTLNTQKAFYSVKHRVGLCMAGDAVLKYEGITNLEQVLYTDYVLNHFFSYLDSLDTFSVSDMQNTLCSFFTLHYSDYWICFQERVSYFYGGFICDGGGQMRTVLYQHHVGDPDSDKPPKIRDNQYNWTEEDDGEPCFFANTNAVQSMIDWTLSDSRVPEGMTAKKLLSDSSEKNRIVVLTFTLPFACLMLNGDTPYSVGQYLYYYLLKTDGVMKQYKVKYKLHPDLGVECLPAEDAPLFKIYCSYKESNAALCEGELSAYDTRDGVLLSPASFDGTKELTDSSPPAKEDADSSESPSLKM